MRRIRRASKHQLHGFIQEAVESPTAPSTPTAGKVTSVWRRLAIGTNTTFWQLPANQP